MTSDPVILVLDDEQPQILALRSQLRGMGEIREFSDPRPALEFARAHRIDAAIVDICMPKLPLDGFDFLKSLREFDRDLSVIVRTGDDSQETADGVIEARAIRRAIKSRTTPEEIRELTKAAIDETRQRRKLTRDAGAAAVVKEELVKTLGSIEDEISVAGACRSILHNMRNHLTAAAGMAEIILTRTRFGKDEALVESAQKNKQVIWRMLNEMNTFLDGPFADVQQAGSSQAHATVNATIDALYKRFLAASYWAAQEKSLEVAGLPENLLVSAHPQRLLTALRHLVEFCFLHCPPKTHLRLTASPALKPTENITNIFGQTLVFNRKVLIEDKGYILFSIRADLGEMTLEKIHQLFHQNSEDPRIGNLHLLSLTMCNDQCVVVIHRQKGNLTVFDLYIPIAL